MLPLPFGLATLSVTDSFMDGVSIMDGIQWAYDAVQSWGGAIATIFIVVVVILIVRKILNSRYGAVSDYRYRGQITTLVLSLAGLVAIILMLPIGDTRQGQLLSLLGILLSAAIALSSTTLVGNAMAGMMIRALRNFRPGDFIRVGDHFGRVSERGLFHVEIQTEDRDLTTLPNLYLVTNPVKVTRSSGTMVTAEVSLGYDIPHGQARELLERAARSARLQDPFAHVVSLGDFSVTYRVSGLLEDVKQLISTRSLLREKILDEFHQNGVEIVSPTFMNTRAIPETRTFIPRSSAPPAREDAAVPRPIPEDLVFDKAEEAESVEKLIERHDALGKEIDELKAAIKDAVDTGAREDMKTRVARLESSRERMAEIIKKRREENKD